LLLFFVAMHVFHSETTVRMAAVLSVDAPLRVVVVAAAVAVDVAAVDVVAVAVAVAVDLPVAAVPHLFLPVVVDQSWSLVLFTAVLD